MAGPRDVGLATVIAGVVVLAVSEGRLVMSAGPAAVGRHHQGDRSSPAPAAQDQQWGPPVDGVQLRLALSPNGSPYLPSDLPLFEVQLRNRGVEPVSYQVEAIAFGELEIDGVRYAEVHFGSCCSAPRAVAAGTDSDVSPMRVIRTQTFQLNSTPARTLVLTPGAHVIRVRSVAMQNYDIHTATRRGLVLTSNSVHFNMPALSPAAERQALIDQASSGGTRGLPAARDDPRQRIGLSAKFDDASYEDPRVCDMAAFVFATRWPNKYRFTWPATLAERDAQIEVIRRARREGAR